MSDTTQPQAAVESSEDSALAALEQAFDGVPPPPKEEAVSESSEDQPEDGEPTVDDLPDVEGEGEQKQEAATDEEFEIVHNGTKVKLSRSDLIANAQKGFDYDRKVQAATESFKQSQAALQRLQEIEQVQSALALESGQVAMLHSRLADERYSDMEMLKLAQSGDILEYQKREAERSFLRNQYQQVAQQFQQKHASVQQYKEQMAAWQLQQEHQRLPELIPAWKDEAKMSADKADIARYLQGIGVDLNQVGRYLDNAPAMKIVRDAMLYQRLSKLQADKSKQVRSAPPVVRPGANAPSDQGKANTAKAVQAIRKAGRAGDSHTQEQLAVGLLNRAFPK